MKLNQTPVWKMTVSTLAGFALSCAASAQGYPTKAITLVVPLLLAVPRTSWLGLWVRP